MLARMVNSLPNGLSQQITKLYFQAYSTSSSEAVGMYSKKAKGLKRRALANTAVLLRNQRKAHSTSEHHQFGRMDVKILPALKDNYMYLLIDKRTNQAAIVDPVEPETVLRAVCEHGVNLTTILTTHHHWDHAGGNQELAQKVPNIEVYGGDDRIGALTQKVEHNTVLNIGNMVVKCLYTPCHTSGHICYYVTTSDEANDSIVFTGDTLFLAGCGRFFEGTPEQMYTAMSIFGNLPDNTKVYCGHEYSVQNLRFANHVEPRNELIKNKLQWAIQRREDGKPTVPSTIAEEKEINPFMRVVEPGVMMHARTKDPIDTMRTIRLEKDSFQ